MENAKTKWAIKRRDLLKLGAAAGVLGLVQARGDSGPPGPAQASAATPTKAAVPKRGGTFIMARPISPKDLSGVWFSQANIPFIRALYNTLVRLDKDYNPQPELAESWQFSPDGRTMTLKLRRGVMFHSGREFTAEDVKFSWVFSTDEKAGLGSQMRQVFMLIRDVKPLDKYTVELRFDQPTPLVFDALDCLAMFDMSVAKKISTTDAGSGPFMVASYTPNDEVRMKRFEGYWESGKPYLDEYVVKVIPDTASLVISLESKVVDAITGAALLDVVRLRAQPGIACDVAATPAVNSLATNVRRPPLDKKMIRQAINYAIDRERCSKVVLRGTVDPTSLHWMKGSWARFADLEGRYPYNLEKAKALMGDAGYANGFETTILVSKMYNDPLFGMGQIIQGELAKIGIKARLRDVESTVFINAWRKADWDLIVINYGRVNRDPAAMLSGAVNFYTKAENGPIGFESPDYEKWRAEAASTLDREKRMALYRKIQEFLLEESFSMPIAADQYIYLYRDYVKNLSYTLDGSPFVGEVWLDK